MQLSVQGYLQQRKRLNPEIFPYLNRKYLMDFYLDIEIEHICISENELEKRNLKQLKKLESGSRLSQFLTAVILP